MRFGLAGVESGWSTVVRSTRGVVEQASGREGGGGGGAGGGEGGGGACGGEGGSEGGGGEGGRQGPHTPQACQVHLMSHVLPLDWSSSKHQSMQIAGDCGGGGERGGGGGEGEGGGGEGGGGTRAQSVPPKASASLA